MLHLYTVVTLILVLCRVGYKTDASLQNKQREVCAIGNDTIKIAALILARGGSKGIPLKNLALFNGMSLLSRTIVTANEAAVFDQIWVSTDHPKIAEEAERSNVHYRPSHLALDETTSIASVAEFLAKHPFIQGVALLQCTSVFIRVNYLQEASHAFRNADCVFAVTRSFKLRWNYTSSKKVVAVNFDPASRPRRQDWNGELIETGMFYFARRHILLNGVFQNDNCSVVEVSEKDAIEIDTPMDLQIAESFANL